MTKPLIVILSLLCLMQISTAQEQDGMVSLTLPVRNSLTFNRYIINPTFSFVREQNKYISIYNKREWVQFEDAPQTYLASFAGRFKENIGAGIGIFQQNNGVLTTFGGVANFAYNVRLTNDTNLTFGLNVGAYRSGINTGNVVTNQQETAIDNVPSSFMVTVNPGINYGTTFFDIGLSINNLVQYDIESSTLYDDTRDQGIQAHLMYTGYMVSRGFFDNSKFSGLLRSEFTNDETIISGTAMLTVPKGVWAQVGYNNMYGAFGGIGINLTNQIAMEYSFERTVGELSQFGPSHEVTLAYKFQNRERYDYSGDDEVAGIISGGNKKKRVSRKRSSKKKSADETLTSLSKEEREAKRALFLEEQKARKEALAQREADAKAKRESKAIAKINEQKAEEEEAEKARLAAAALAQKQAEEKSKADKAEQERIAVEKARELAEQKAKEEAERQAQLEADRKARLEADRLARLEAERKARIEAERQARLENERKAKAKAEAEERARLEAERIAKEKVEEAARIEAERKARLEAQEQARLEAERIAREKAEVQKIEAERLAKVAEEQAEKEAERLVKEQEEAKLKQDSINSLIDNPQDAIGKSMKSISASTEASRKTQDDLLKRLNDIVDVRDQDLKDLKEENDLSEQGITKSMTPKPFKSISEENNRLLAIQTDLDKVIAERDKEIKQLEALFEDKFEADTLYNDVVMLHYKKKIKQLKAEQANALRAKTTLTSKLEAIDVAMEYERKRRIKRAVYDNEEDRYNQDRLRLSLIKKNTPLSDAPLTEDDFDFGEKRSGGIQILKNINKTENGYYLILAVHSNVEKRDEFLKNAVAAGRNDIDFFFDVTTNKYYIYYKKSSGIEGANSAMESKGTQPYNTNMSIVKIEN